MNSAGLRFALIGENIAYSKSPAIFDAIFSLSGQNGSFEIISVSQSRLASRLKQLVLDGYSGLSVTIPLKQAVIAHLDDIDTVARTVDAANCIAVVDGQLFGYNTDVYGLSYSLRPYAAQLKNREALVLGNGGAARAAVYALHRDFDVRQVTICGRSIERLKNCARVLRTHLPDLEPAVIRCSDFAWESFRERKVIVNATPLGGPNHTDVSPLPKQFHLPRESIYIDLNYNADNTLLRQAKESGLTTIDGSGMLVGQAVKAFEIWTGLTVPFQPVYQVVFGNQSGKQAMSHG